MLTLTLPRRCAPLPPSPIGRGKGPAAAGGGKGEGRVRLYETRPSGTVDRARQLRRDAPEPERRLLRALRSAFPQLKWRHQAPLGPYYADILCFSAGLVIEVDGDTHAASVDHDARRDTFMHAEGYRVLRFTNADVTQNLEGVLTTISLSLREREGAPQAREGEGDRAKGKGVST